MLRNVPEAGIEDWPRERGECVCRVVGLCPDNLRAGWGTDTEWLLNVEAL